MNPRRVAFVVTGLGVGGAERQVIDLSRALSNRGIAVLVVTLLDPTGWGLALVGDSARVESLGVTRGRPDPRAILRLRNILSSWQPDVVHSHMLHANISTRLARPGTDWALVNTIHNEPTSHRWLERLQSATRPLSDQTTIISRAVFKKYLERRLVSRERTIVVYNGIETDRFDDDGYHPTEPRPFTWVSIGSLRPEKDQLTLLRAISELGTSSIAYRLWIAGVGSLEGVLRQTIHDLQIADRVTLLGHIDDIPSLLRESDAVVSSSQHEGLPIALIEASAAARPIVATDAGGTREIVHQGATGLVTRPGDAPSLARSMAAIMALTPVERAEMGAEAKKRAASHFDLDSITEQWLAIYRALLADGPKEYRR